MVKVYSLDNSRHLSTVAEGKLLRRLKAIAYTHFSHLYWLELLIVAQRPQLQITTQHCPLFKKNISYSCVNNGKCNHPWQVWSIDCNLRFPLCFLPHYTKRSFLQNLNNFCYTCETSFCYFYLTSNHSSSSRSHKLNNFYQYLIDSLYRLLHPIQVRLLRPIQDRN